MFASTQECATSIEDEFAYYTESYAQDYGADCGAAFETYQTAIFTSVECIDGEFQLTLSDEELEQLEDDLNAACDFNADSPVPANNPNNPATPGTPPPPIDMGTGDMSTGDMGTPGPDM